MAEIHNSKELQERGTLQLDDLVYFGALEYQVTYTYMIDTARVGTNRRIFELLEYDAEEVAAEMYGYEFPVDPTDTCWPECHRKDYEALTRLVAELYAKYEATIHLYASFEDTVRQVEGYPGNGMNYPRVDEELQKFHRISHAAMEIASESGEVVGILKDWLQNDKPIPVDKMVEELGDLRHGIQLICNILDIDAADLEPLHAKKLNSRFPGLQFATKDKSQRNPEAEAKIFAKYRRDWR